MYPIEEMEAKFMFKSTGEYAMGERFIKPLVTIEITHPDRDNSFAIVNLVYSINCEYKDTKTSCIASASNTYSVIKNDTTAVLFTQGKSGLAGNGIKQLMCLSYFPQLVDKNSLLCGSYNKKLLLFVGLSILKVLSELSPIT